MWMTWITDSGADAEFKTQEQRLRRSSMSLRILARSSRATSSGTRRRLRWNRSRHETKGGGDRRALSGGLSRRARSCLRHRRAADSRGGRRERNWRANFPAGGEALRGFVASGFASIPLLFSIVCGLISVLAVPGGLVTRALRHAVVRRDGREIGRARSAVRFLVAWSPVIAWIACVGDPMFGEPRVSPAAAFVVGGLALI